jgi:hypothetical protein
VDPIRNRPGLGWLVVTAVGLNSDRSLVLTLELCRTYVCIQSNGTTTVIQLIFSDVSWFLLVRAEESLLIV